MSSTCDEFLSGFKDEGGVEVGCSLLDEAECGGFGLGDKCN